MESTKDPANKYKEFSFLGLPVRRLGVENWTEDDFIEESRRNKITSEISKTNKQTMIDRGWEFHFPYCSRDCNGPFENGEWAVDPETKALITHKEAYRLQEQREPGSIVPHPVFDNGWSPPSSTEGLFNIEMGPRKPMVIQRKTETDRWEIIRRKEDERVFEALDKIALNNPDTAEARAISHKKLYTEELDSEISSLLEKTYGKD